jgi:predicted adenine nucleotide alpha hydrolase (AANH) superfamily ATPase
MKVLLHICCAPCAIVPVRELRSAGTAVTGFFYRHNIHPFSECLRRQQTLDDYARQIGLEMIWQAGYDLEGFIRSVVYREEERCLICYRQRLLATAALARQGNYDAYSTTLLYSRYQRHDALRDIGESLGRTLGVAFLYRDFRPGWKQGIEESRRIGLYRQKYCGCVYSEKERFFKDENGLKAPG